MTEPIGPLEPGRAYTCRVHLHQSDVQRARALLGRRETRYFGDLCNLIFASAAAQRAGGGGALVPRAASPAAVATAPPAAVAAAAARNGPQLGQRSTAALQAARSW